MGLFLVSERRNGKKEEKKSIGRSIEKYCILPVSVPAALSYGHADFSYDKDAP